MKRIKCIALVSALVLAAGGCSDDPELYITLPESQSKVMNIDAKTQSITVNVEHNVDMEVTISEEATWLTQGGTTENTYTFNAAENDDTAERKATITFANTANGLSQTVEVTQAGRNWIDIPDPKFKEYCLKNYDSNGDGKISFEEAANVTRINVQNKKITSLEGIEWFTELDTLNFNANQVDSLDVSKNTKLTYLNCQNNQLTSLDVSKNTKLINLNCIKNKVAKLDVTLNTELETLDCGTNELTELDVSHNKNLEKLNCVNNLLTNLDVSNNTALTNLSCSQNQLTNLDVSNHTKLDHLYCFSNQLINLNVTDCTALAYLNCHDNQLTDLDVSKTGLGVGVTAQHYPILCAPMDDESGKNLLETLTLKNGWSIKGITGDSRSEKYIPKETEIKYVEVE